MKKSLTPAQKVLLLETLKTRFEQNTIRHLGLEWKKVLSALEKQPEKLESLFEMEGSGGEPDVVGYDKKNGFHFFDCSVESPAGRRSFCYDPEALASRKEHKPKNSAVGMASMMGVELLSEDQYRFLQTLGSFDLKTSSWVKTPDAVRELDGALFCDRRFNRVFVYHNGVESYYAGRGFRACLYV